MLIVSSNSWSVWEKKFLKISNQPEVSAKRNTSRNRLIEFKFPAIPLCWEVFYLRDGCLRENIEKGKRRKLEVLLKSVRMETGGFLNVAYFHFRLWNTPSARELPAPRWDSIPFAFWEWLWNFLWNSRQPWCARTSWKARSKCSAQPCRR